MVTLNHSWDITVFGRKVSAWTDSNQTREWLWVMYAAGVQKEGVEIQF